jgi:hypothetical protein
MHKKLKCQLQLEAIIHCGTIFHNYDSRILNSSTCMQNRSSIRHRKVSHNLSIKINKFHLVGSPDRMHKSRAP